MTKSKSEVIQKLTSEFPDFMKQIDIEKYQSDHYKIIDIQNDLWDTMKQYAKSIPYTSRPWLQIL